MHDECRFSVMQQRDFDSESAVSANSQKSGDSSRSSFSSPSSSPLSSCAVSHKTSLSSRSGSKRRRTKTHNKRLGTSAKGYAAHVPVFSNHEKPTTIVLEPFPNRKLRSLCIAGGALVTAHRNGIRVYRQRYLSPTQTVTNSEHDENYLHNGEKATRHVDITDIRTGIWEAVEFRDDFKFKDAYLCAGVDLVFNRERFFPLKWSRYLAVACGCDRTHFSVCVLSTAAHFVLHHELHKRNKIVALNFALVAMEASPDTRRYQPFVVSVDEVGEVVIFDVENDRAVKLLAPSAALDNTTTETVTDDSDRELAHSFTTSGNSNKNTNKDNTNDDGNCEKDLSGGYGDENFSLLPNKTSEQSNSGSTSGAGGGASLRVYRLDAGLASAVSLVGPCQVYCKNCSDVAFVPGSLVMSLYISSRSNCADGQAELQVTQLCFRWRFFPPRAVLISENHIVRESAPEGVCDVGIAMMQVPFYDGLPQRFMIGRPRLRFWSISGCTGRLLQLHRVYNDMDGSGKGARTLKEHFVRVVPLGRHVLIQDDTTSWLCIAALTDDDVILLLGTEPLPTTRRDTFVDFSQALCATEPGLAPEVVEKQTLEQWLDEVERDEETNEEEEKKEEKEDKKEEKERQQHLKKGGKGTTSCLTPPLIFMDPKKDYTVLMVLAGPGSFVASLNLSLDKSFSNSRTLVFVPQSNELLFFMGGTERVYSVKLPFELHVTSDKGKLNAKKEEVTKKPWGNILRGESGGWMESAFNGKLLLDLQIARPLMTAVFGLAGETEVSQKSLFPLKASLHQPKEEKALAEAENVNGSRDDSPTSCCTSTRAGKDVQKDSCGRLVRRKKHRSNVVSVMDADGHGDLSLGVNNNSNNKGANSNADVQEAYIDAERQKILKAHHLWSHAGGAKEQRGGCGESGTTTCTQITTQDEPLQRDTIVYEWSDTHDNLYVQFINELQELIEKEKDTNMAKSDTCLLGRPNQRCLRQNFRLSDIKDCLHSAGFLRAFRDAQQKRLELSDKGGVFDFSTYFASNVVPRRVLDLQENDRCRFELADLKVDYEDDISKLNEVDTVVVYENEERRVDANGRRLWMPHQTFPFDDERGNVVDITALNSTAALPGSTETTSVIAVAAMLSPSTSTGWRWQHDATGDGVLRPSGPKIVRKELQSWSIGEWMYAERWPTREEEMSGAFKWNTKAGVGTANVRRRRLTRNRINVAVEAAKEARHEEYKKKHLQLRMTLGL